MEMIPFEILIAELFATVCGGGGDSTIFFWDCFIFIGEISF